jgi:hypothetical protein
MVNCSASTFQHSAAHLLPQNLRFIDPTFLGIQWRKAIHLSLASVLLDLGFNLKVEKSAKRPVEKASQHLFLGFTPFQVFLYFSSHFSISLVDSIS